ncbi:MAG: hypothetical protein FWC94_03175 [Bacteroidales bacterium]|nr:hypothetical protein [Bacteroidales bacterium]
MTKKKIVATFFLALVCVVVPKAQPNFGVEYITDFQTNFGRNYNWSNLLHLSLEIPSETINKRWTNGRFLIQSRTAYHLFERGVIDDLMGYNNILGERIPFSLAMLGYQQQWGRFSVFFGVRNINQDYFTDPYMSLFTNSTPGMLPTLSFNFPLADYPFSAICLHAEFQITDNWLLKTSLYNGIAHNPQKKPLRSFRLNPRNDGIFSISEIVYTQNRIGQGIYSFGVAAHSSRRMRPSFFAEIEQSIFKNEQHEMGFILQAGYSHIATSLELNDGLNGDSKCKSILGIGLYFRGLFGKDRCAFGVNFNTANFVGISERALEITWRYQWFERLAIQPAFHVVRTGSQTGTVGMLRFIFTL